MVARLIVKIIIKITLWVAPVVVYFLLMIGQRQPWFPDKRRQVNIVFFGILAMATCFTIFWKIPLAMRLYSFAIIIAILLSCIVFELVIGF